MDEEGGLHRRDLKRRRQIFHTLAEDCWQIIISYADVADLCSIALVCKGLKDAAENNEAWISHCARLWRDKQNHPFERWIRLSPTDFTLPIPKHYSQSTEAAMGQVKSLHKSMK